MHLWTQQLSIETFYNTITASQLRNSDTFQIRCRAWPTTTLGMIIGAFGRA
jgi:hypothetical protein